MTAPSTQQRTYTITPQGLFLAGTYVTQANGVITLLLNIDPDMPRVMQHGRHDTVHRHAIMRSVIYHDTPVQDRWKFGTQMLYTLPIRSDTITMIQEILDDPTRIPRFVVAIESMRKQDPDTERFAIYSALTGAQAP